MTTPITLIDLQNAALDTATIAAVANGPATGSGSTVISRLGTSMPTLAHAASIGVSGPPGTNGANGASSFAGAYNSGTTYAQYEAVSYNGSSYVSLVAGNVGNSPATSPSQWALLAAAGTGALIAASTLASVIATDPNNCNLFDKTTTTPGMKLNADGTLSDGSGWTTSNFVYCPNVISMITNIPITISQASIVLYDGAGNIIGVIDRSALGAAYNDGPNNIYPNVAFPLPGTQVYMRFSYIPTHYGSITDATAILYASTSGTATMPASYTPFGNATNARVAALENAGYQTAAQNLVTAVEFANNVLPNMGNLLDYTRILSNTKTNNDGTTSSGSGWATSPLIYCPGATSAIANLVIRFEPNSVYFNTFDSEGHYIETLPESYFGSAVNTGPNNMNSNQPFPLRGNQTFIQFCWVVSQQNGGPFPSAPSSWMVFANTASLPTSPVAYGFATNDALTKQIAANGSAFESRILSVQRVENVALTPGQSVTLFDQAGPGSIERFQCVINTSSNPLNGAEAMVLTFTVDGTTFTSSLGMFLLCIGYGDGNAASDCFSTKWLANVNVNTTRGGHRKIYIPFTTHCTIVATMPSGSAIATTGVYTQVEYYRGATPSGIRHPNQKVFHMVTNEWAGSSLAGDAIKTLLSGGTGPGILHSIYLATSYVATAGTFVPGWLEGNPLITVDGNGFEYGGTEDFFGAQDYAYSFQPRADEWGLARYGQPNTQFYFNGYRYFDNNPMPFSTSLDIEWPSGWNNAIQCGTQVVYYTQS